MTIIDNSPKCNDCKTLYKLDITPYLYFKPVDQYYFKIKCKCRYNYLETNDIYELWHYYVLLGGSEMCLKDADYESIRRWGVPLL